jgi:hypothetical protein
MAIFEEDPTMRLFFVFLILVFVLVGGSIAMYYYERTTAPEVVKCMNACDTMFSKGDFDSNQMDYKERCVSQCMNLSDTQAPRIYKAECIYRVEQVPTYVNPYWDNWGTMPNYITNGTLFNISPFYDKGWLTVYNSSTVYVNGK